MMRSGDQSKIAVEKSWERDLFMYNDSRKTVHHWEGQLLLLFHESNTKFRTPPIAQLFNIFRLRLPVGSKPAMDVEMERSRKNKLHMGGVFHKAGKACPQVN